MKHCLLACMTITMALCPLFAHAATTPGNDTLQFTAALRQSTQQLTRGEFVKFLVDHLYTSGERSDCFQDISPTRTPRFTLIFTDVHVEHPAAQEICVAMKDGLVRGYRDGSFRPDEWITTAEAAKIIARAYALTPYADALMQEPWFKTYMQELSNRRAIPQSITSFSQKITLGELTEIAVRLDDGITWNPSRSYDELVRMSAPKKTLPPSARPSQGSMLMEGPSSAPSAPTPPPAPAPASAPSSAKPWYQFY